MSVAAYADYKNSGVAWLGVVPSHWELTRVGAKFWERREKVSDADYPALSVTKKGIVPQLDTAAKTDDNDNRKCVLAGDFVINSRSDRNGSSGLSELDGSVSLINTVIRAYDGMDDRFIHHLFRSVSFQQEYYRYGKGIVADLWSTNYGEMKAICLAVPPLTEQKAIAIFLDRETAKIDALVAEQERLIALLKEKRQAVISHAVTKGLNPNAPMKDSGIEWLGEIPAHWDLLLLKRCFRQIDYGISESLESAGAIAILRMGNIQDARIVLDQLKYVDSVDPALLLEENDLLFNRTNSLEQIAKVGLFEGGADFPISLASYLVRLRTNDSVSPRFLSYLLNTNGILGVARSRAFVAIGQCNLNPTRYGEITVAMPPLHEQLDIATHIKRLADEIDILTRIIHESSYQGFADPALRFDDRGGRQFPVAQVTARFRVFAGLRGWA